MKLLNTELQHEHTFRITVVFEFLLLQVGMALHLVDSRNNLGRLEKPLSLCDGEVGDTNGFDEPFSN